MPAKSYQFTTYNLKGNAQDPGKLILVGYIVPASFKDSLSRDRLLMRGTCDVQMLQEVRREITTLKSDRCQVQ